MNCKLYFKSEDGALGYVESVNPVQYNTIQSKAFSIVFDLDSVDEDFIENEIWEPLEKLIDETGITSWELHFDDDDTVDEACKMLVDEDGILVAINGNLPSMTLRVENKFREIASSLSDFMGSKMAAMSLKSAMANYTPVNATGPKSTGTAHSKGMSDETDIDSLISRIEAETKASIVKPKETLADYMCNSTLKEELEEIKNFFEDRASYASLGIRLPKGVLFKGIPGTGKTYAARCIAGSVDCYFMSCTASSLQGMYIGSGAENIKKVFEAAKILYSKSGKGVILFIDEIDSFGSRETHGGNSGGEEDRTLNQLLAEMSGFEDSDGVMVLAATNFPERIDEALMRSGRFSRQITIDVPEEVERLSLVQYYFNKINIPCDKDCDEATIAAITEGMTPADIAEVANESGILTVRNKDCVIKLSAVNEAINKVITKNIRKPDKSKEFHRAVAVHEAGHVLAEYIYGKCFSIKVTNYSYGDAGGFTQPRHKSEGIVSEANYKNDIMMLLGGRAAEAVVLGEISTGASEDLMRARRRIKAYFETYHFDTYNVDTLDQLVEDTMWKWCEECMNAFKEPDALRALNELAARIDTDRVLYTRHIRNILTTYI